MAKAKGFYNYEVGLDPAQIENPPSRAAKFTKVYINSKPVFFPKAFYRIFLKYRHGIVCLNDNELSPYVSAKEDSGRSDRLTPEEFDKTVFFRGMECIYKGEVRPIIRINRFERLISFYEYYDPQASWVRYESVSLIKAKQ